VSIRVRTLRLPYRQLVCSERRYFGSTPPDCRLPTTAFVVPKHSGDDGAEDGVPDGRKGAGARGSAARLTVSYS
jgi:hypothetical protein